MITLDSDARIANASAILMTLYDIRNPEFRTRFILLGLTALTFILSMGLWLFFYWFVLYYFVISLSLLYLWKTPKASEQQRVSVLLAVEVFSTTTFIIAPFYLWSQPELILNFAGTALLFGAILNSFTIRANIPAIAILDVVTNGAVILYIGTLFTGPETSGLARYLGPGIAVMTVIYYAVILHEVFSVRRETKRLNARAAEAEKMQALGQLTGGIAHDFNNILTVVIGNLELSDVVSDESERQVLVDDAKLAAERASHLTSQLLAFSRKLPLRAREIELDFYLAEFVASSRLAGREDIEVMLDIDPTLATVYIDPDQFRRALDNLADNSLDVMPHGGTIHICATNITLPDPKFDPDRKLVDGNYVVLEFHDSGPGISHDVRDRIFEPFFTTKPIGKGSGLGLSMVKGFASQSGGKLRLLETKTKGTAFSLVLPTSYSAPDQSTTKLSA